MENPIPIQKTKVFRVKVELDKGIAFEGLCKNEKTNINAKLKELINDTLRGNKRYFLAGKNEIIYDKTNDFFSWIVELDSKQEIEILNNLSDSFLINLKKAIDKAIQDRNEWINQSKPDSINIPEKLVGGRNG